MLFNTRRWIAPLIAAFSCACVLAPKELAGESDKLAHDGAPYALPFEERTLPALSAHPDWHELLYRAFLANGELEAAWQEWRGAVARVTRESTWPNSNVELSFDYAVSDGLSAWESTSLGIGFDPDTMLDLPFKTELMGSIAFAEARAAGERFRAARFALQRRFIEGWVELARLEGLIALEEETLALSSSASSAAERGAVVGSHSASFVRSRIELAALENGILALKSAAEQAAARLRAIANVPPGTVIDARDAWPMQSAPHLADDEILALAARSNPRLIELARTVEGRADALELARAAWWPNISPSAGLTGSMTRFIGASLSLPLSLPRVTAQIEEAQAGVDRSQALARQGAADVNAAITAELLALREAERAHAFLEGTLVPLSNQLSLYARSAYAGGTASQMEWLDAMRAVVDARRALLDARAAREASLARLEEWVGVDLSTLAPEPEVTHAQ